MAGAVRQIPGLARNLNRRGFNGVGSDDVPGAAVNMKFWFAVGVARPEVGALSPRQKFTEQILPPQPMLDGYSTERKISRIAQQKRYSSAVKSKTIIAGAVLLVVLFFATIIFTFLPKPPQSITVRYIKSVQSGKATTITFEITNHTDQTYLLDPVWVRTRNGLAWPITDKFSNPMFNPHRSVTATFNLTNLPTGSPLRLMMTVGKELAGLKGLFLRLDLRFRQGQKQI
jgi:hypothetical protein